MRAESQGTSSSSWDELQWHVTSHAAGPDAVELRRAADIAGSTEEKHDLAHTGKQRRPTTEDPSLALTRWRLVRSGVWGVSEALVRRLCTVFLSFLSCRAFDVCGETCCWWKGLSAMSLCFCCCEQRSLRLPDWATDELVLMPGLFLHDSVCPRQKKSENRTESELWEHMMPSEHADTC